jgi:hypothetical protein
MEVNASKMRKLVLGLAFAVILSLATTIVTVLAVAPAGSVPCCG